jgi:hypothetical protein
MQIYYQPIDKNLKKSINSILNNNISKFKNIDTNSIQNDIYAAPASALIWEKNIFDSKRGKTIKVVEHSTPNIELLGVCAYGNQKYAFINFKNLNNSFPNNKKKKPKTFFKVGDKLPNGFLLKSIGDNYVIIAGEKEDIKVMLQHNSKEGKYRVQKTYKDNVQTQISIINESNNSGKKKKISIEVSPAR